MGSSWRHLFYFDLRECLSGLTHPLSLSFRERAFGPRVEICFTVFCILFDKASRLEQIFNFCHSVCAEVAGLNWSSSSFNNYFLLSADYLGWIINWLINKAKHIRADMSLRLLGVDCEMSVTLVHRAPGSECVFYVYGNLLSHIMHHLFHNNKEIFSSINFAVVEYLVRFITETSHLKCA